MNAMITVRPQCFVARLQASDYQIYRDGFCLLIKTDRARQGYVLNVPDLEKMLLRFGYLVSNALVEQLLTREENLSVFSGPNDEQIIEYCIKQAIIPHPYEEYVS